MKLKLTVRDFVSVNHYMSYRAVRKGLVMPFKPKSTKDFEKKFSRYVKEEIQKQQWSTPPKNVFINLDTIFYFPRVDMDAQNYFKSMCDIMSNCGVWIDDNVVMEKVNRIYYDSEDPRIELEITYSDYVGIFDNQDEFKLFESNCSKCKRFKNNCSIFKKAMESRIQKEIVRNEEKWECISFKELKNKSIVMKK